MRISRFTVNRPIFTLMIVFIVIILGGLSFINLPIDLMPDITYPTLSVSTSYSNASPQEMEELVTRPIEESMSAVPGVEELTSVSSEGTSNVRVSFAWGTNLDAAANDIRDRLDRVIPRLPDDADRPVLRKFDLAQFPVLIFGAYGNLDPIQLEKLIQDHVKYRIESIPGVAALDIWGGMEREIHINLDRDKIKALEIPIDQILARIRAENVTVPAGTLERGNLEILVRTPGQYTNLAELENTLIALRSGETIRLSEIASVEDTHQKVTRLIRINGKPGVRLSVQKQSGTNTVEVASGVLNEIRKINEDLPQIHLTPIIDTSDYIRRSITNLGTAALYGGLLAILVLLLFLRNLRSTIIIATSIPISIVATFALMYFSGFTLNIMTLGGMALGIGMLVDSAIVVLENIYRLRESGLNAKEAAVEGSEEVTSAIIASTLTTVVVFLPLIFMQGMSGVMFKQLAYVVGFALLCSLVVSLALVPMLASRLLRVTGLEVIPHESLTHRIFRISGRFLIRIENEYKNLLHFSLNHRLLVIIPCILFLGACILLVPYIGTELMPSADEGEVRISVEMQVGTRLALLDEKFKIIEAIVEREVPEALNVVIRLGGSSWRGSGSHSGDTRIALKPQAERNRSSEEIAGVLRKKLSPIPGITVRTRAGQGLFLLRMGQSDTDRIQVEVRGYNLETADALAKKVREVIDNTEGVTDTRVSRESGSPEDLILVDREKAADMKLTVSEIANTLQTILSGTRTGSYREGGDEYRILVKVKDADKIAIQDLLDLTVTNTEGEPVVLRNVVQVTTREGPVKIERKNQERTITITANTSDRDMGSIIQDIQKGFLSIPVPTGFSLQFGGDYEEQQKAFRELLIGLILALVLVYMVMASLYESIQDPFVVMFSSPFAAIGVILMLFLTHTTFNVQSYIGCIMLGGIVVNNAILLVDHTNLLRRRDGIPLREAIEEAGRRRLRPILMTSMTTSLCLLPLALGLGESGEAQAPLARAVIGGLLSSTLITLVLIPVIYSLFEGLKKENHLVEPPDLTQHPVLGENGETKL